MQCPFPEAKHDDILEKCYYYLSYQKERKKKRECLNNEIAKEALGGLRVFWKWMQII